MAKKRLKVHSLTGRIDMTRMHSAFRKVKRNGGCPGVDGVTIEMFEANLEQNLAALMFDLKHRGHYHAMPLLRVYVPKGKGKKMRALGIPTVRDRVAQEVIRALLEPIFEPTFAECSYGFRPGRNAHQAIDDILRAYLEGNKVVVEVDIQSFFDNIPHELIIDLVAERVADGNILLIIREFLTAEVVEDEETHPVVLGTPQGGVISPLLANIVLDVLDQRLIQAGFRLIRYADDFVILCPNSTSAEQALALTIETLDMLSLSVSPEKTLVTPYWKGFDFLGFRIARRTVSVRQKSMEKFKDKIRSLTNRSHNLDQETIISLNRVITGFANYFAAPFSTVEEQFYLLDCWIRMRLRCMKYKRISRGDNRRFPNKNIARMGLVSLYSFTQ
jgi:group II intron reverse transcriptase/maturase